MAKKGGNGLVSKSSEMDDWQVESDLRTIMDCEKIENDPKRIKAVRDLAKKKLMEVASIASGVDNDTGK